MAYRTSRVSTFLNTYNGLGMSAQLIEIVVNGERKLVASGLTIRRLLEALEIPADRVAVELNKSIVRKRNWEETPVETGAQLEIVQFVGGG